MSQIAKIIGAPITTTAPPTTLAPTAAPTTAAPTTVAPTGSGVTGYDAINDDATITGAAAADTKGAWTELVASSANTYVGLLIGIRWVSASNVPYLLDIGIGGAGAEVVLVPDIGFDQGINTINVVEYLFVPVNIASGTRIAARCQSTDGGSDVLYLSVYGVKGTFQGYDTVEMNGADAGTTKLTSVDPGDTADTKGDWVELAASISGDYAYIGLISTSQDFVRTTCTWRVDIGVGADGEEVIIAADLAFAVHGNSDQPYPKLLGMIPLDIATGSRIAVRAECNINTVGDRLINLALIGAYS